MSKTALVELLEKEEVLKKSGYIYNFQRMIYYNPETRKAFSVEAVEDHDKTWIQKKIKEKATDNWHFYFNKKPSPSIQRELENALHS